jgi:Circadian oscillating protein COP23
MKQKKILQWLIGLNIGFSVSFINSKIAHSSLYSYYCDQYDGIPTTFVSTNRGELPMIRWVSVNLPSATPEQRCQTVSGNFQRAYENGNLKFITTGQMNNQPVVCTTASRGGSCQDLLFTLKPGSNPKTILRRLLDRRGLAAGNPLEQAGEEFYLDFEDYLNRLSSRDTSTEN